MHCGDGALVLVALALVSRHRPGFDFRNFIVDSRLAGLLPDRRRIVARLIRPGTCGKEECGNERRDGHLWANCHHWVFLARSQRDRHE